VPLTLSDATPRTFRKEKEMDKRKDYKAWITRKINTALSLLIEADEIYVEMYGGGYCDYHEASAIDCYIERARLTAHEALDFMKSLPDETPNELPNTNGGEG
jgi:lipid II:glycine glycyltransferase (peptidoglycan interpeptide bridge formation enzyme)